jgi:hypothetical protein
MNHVILFEHVNFHGAHKHVVAREDNLNASDDNYFNDKVSSIVVFEGNWTFAKNAGQKSPYSAILGPGLYKNVVEYGIPNDDMSSLEPTSKPATTKGDPLDYHIILFKNAEFRGDHKHVFGPEPNLNASDDNSFNDAVSSLGILNGNWQLYKNSGFNTAYPPILGAGGYPTLPFNVTNDDMSSLQPASKSPTEHGKTPIGQGVILFKNANFRGDHKHALTEISNLNAPDDNSFNDAVSSIAVLSGTWQFYKNANTQSTPYPQALGPGGYPWVVDVGIQNDQISALKPSSL